MDELTMLRDLVVDEPTDDATARSEVWRRVSQGEMPRPAARRRRIAVAVAVLVVVAATASAFATAREFIFAKPTITRSVDGIRFSFSLPPHRAGGWTASPIVQTDAGFREGRLGISKSIMGPQGAEAIIFWTSFPNGSRTSTCSDLLERHIGSSAADLANAVATTPGVKHVTGPSDVRVGGLPAKHVVLTVRTDNGCDPGFFYSWYSECWGPCWVQTSVGDTIRVWIVEVRGIRLFIEAETTPQANRALEREIEQIVNSLRFA